MIYDRCTQCCLCSHHCVRLMIISGKEILKSILIMNCWFQVGFDFMCFQCCVHWVWINDFDVIAIMWLLLIVLISTGCFRIIVGMFKCQETFIRRGDGCKSPSSNTVSRIFSLTDSSGRRSCILTTFFKYCFELILFSL